MIFLKIKLGLLKELESNWIFI